MKSEEFISRLDEIAKVYADRPPLFSTDEIEKAIQHGKNYGSEAVFIGWQDYLKEHPGAHFTEFMVDVDLSKAFMPREKAQQELRKILVNLTQKKKAGNYPRLVRDSSTDLTNLSPKRSLCDATTEKKVEA